jgi:transposase
MDEILYRPYARGPKNARIYADISGKRVARTSVISAYNEGGFKSPLRFRGHTNTTVFNYWVETVLLPDLRPGQVVIMDNATFHKSPKTRALIESVGCLLIYLPPYSPDLNKIEPMWANLKNALKSYQDTQKSFFENLDDRILKMCSC